MRHLAIHARAGSFSDSWIAYCNSQNVSYKLVDCFQPDIVAQLEDCWGLMWHWHHLDHGAQLFARQLTMSLEAKGLRVFPSTQTAFHYDDKIGQKYLLEAIGAPVIPSYVFYSEADARAWARSASFPAVWKLRRGAGSRNVRLAQSRAQAESLIARSFSKGWRQEGNIYALTERVWHFQRDRTFRSLANIGKGLYRTLLPHPNHRAQPIEKGYAYFQEFIPGNTSDTRVVAIGERAFAIKRHIRKDDFRASGSGKIDYDPSEISPRCVQLAFDLNNRLGAQCLAYDFVFTAAGQPLVVEISYAFTAAAYRLCPGYWDRSLSWHGAECNPERFMIEDFLHAAPDA